MDKHEFDERVDQLKELAKTNNYDQAVDIANTFLNTPFEGGRHERRVKKI